MAASPVQDTPLYVQQPDGRFSSAGTTQLRVMAQPLISTARLPEPVATTSAAVDGVESSLSRTRGRVVMVSLCLAVYLVMDIAVLKFFNAVVVREMIEDIQRVVGQPAPLNMAQFAVSMGMSFVMTVFLALLVPMCGYAGAKGNNSSLMCCFCGCNAANVICGLLAFLALAAFAPSGYVVQNYVHRCDPNICLRSAQERYQANDTVHEAFLDCLATAEWPNYQTRYPESSLHNNQPLLGRDCPKIFLKCDEQGLRRLDANVANKNVDCYFDEECHKKVDWEKIASLKTGFFARVKALKEKGDKADLKILMQKSHALCAAAGMPDDRIDFMLLKWSKYVWPQDANVANKNVDCYFDEECHKKVDWEKIASLKTGFFARVKALEEKGDKADLKIVMQKSHALCAAAGMPDDRIDFMLLKWSKYVWPQADVMEERPLLEAMPYVVEHEPMASVNAPMGFLKHDVHPWSVHVAHRHHHGLPPAPAEPAWKVCDTEPKLLTLYQQAEELLPGILRKVGFLLVMRLLLSIPALILGSMGFCYGFSLWQQLRSADRIFTSARCPQLQPPRNASVPSYMQPYRAAPEPAPTGQQATPTHTSQVEIVRHSSTASQAEQAMRAHSSSATVLSVIHPPAPSAPVEEPSAPQAVAPVAVVSATPAPAPTPAPATATDMLAEAVAWEAQAQQQEDYGDVEQAIQFYTRAASCFQHVCRFDGRMSNLNIASQVRGRSDNVTARLELLNARRCQ